ncbi:ion channel [Paenibacillus thailandensis]|uniref:Ion channel n=1 Tax=Paenibacillus thailandensis TaxID=393250 RepID=A0ABW5QWG2_9BACL
MFFFQKALEKIIQMNDKTLLKFIAVFFAASPAIIHWLEPEKFPTYWQGLWWVVVTTTTVGYGDYFPVTKAGMAFGVIVIFAGLFIIGAGIGKITDKFLTWKRQKEEGKLDYKGKGHYVVIGWSEDKIKDAVGEMLNADLRADIVLIADLPKTPFEHERIHYISGDPTEHETLDRANAAEAKAVIIFAPQGITPQLADGQTLLIATTIESYGEKTNRDIYTVAEILKENHRIHFKHAKVDELILSQQSISYLIASATIQKGASKLFMNLLSKQHGDELYAIGKKKHWITYNDAYEELKSLGAVLVSDHDDTGIIRKLEQPIPEHARLFIIADELTYRKIADASPSASSAASDR